LTTFHDEDFIEKHKSNLFQKTDTNNAINLILYAFRNGLAEIE